MKRRTFLKSGALVADCDLRLLAGKPVEAHLKLARREPPDWPERRRYGDTSP